MRKNIEPSRREFLKLTAAFGLGHMLGPFAANLRTMGALSTVSAPMDYKALVCIFLQGGNDSANMLLATDPDSWERYQSARNQGPQPIALAAVGTAPNPSLQANLNAAALGGVLPIVPQTVSNSGGGFRSTLRA